MAILESGLIGRVNDLDGCHVVVDVRRIVVAGLVALLGAGCSSSHGHRPPDRVNASSDLHGPGFPSEPVEYYGVQFVHVRPATGCQNQISAAHPYCVVTVVVRNFAQQSASNLRITASATEGVISPSGRLSYRKVTLTVQADRTTYRNSHGVKVPLTLPGGSSTVLHVRADLSSPNPRAEGGIDLRATSAVNRQHGYDGPYLIVNWSGYNCAGTYADDEAC